MLIDFLKVRVMRQMPRDNDFLMEESNGTGTGYFIRNYIIGKILLGIFNFKHDTAADPADCLPFRYAINSYTEKPITTIAHRKIRTESHCGVHTYSFGFSCQKFRE